MLKHVNLHLHDYFQSGFYNSHIGKLKKLNLYRLCSNNREIAVYGTFEHVPDKSVSISTDIYITDPKIFLLTKGRGTDHCKIN